MGTIDIIIIIFYMLCMIGVGLYAKKKIKTVDDFVLGGRRFNRFALVGTIMATMMGSGMVIGVVSNVYQNGITGSIIWVYGGMAVGMVAIAVMSNRIRKTGAMSFAEIINKSFGKEARLVSAIVVVLYSVCILAITVAGLRTVIITIFGDSLPISIPMLTVIATIIAIAYTSLGGFFAVVWTDMVQLVIIVLAIFIIGPIIGVNMAGGVDTITTAYTNAGSSLTNPLLNGFTVGMLGLGLSYLLATPGDPVMPQRVLAAKSDKVSKSSFLISCAMSVLIVVSLLLLGGSIFTIMPGLDNPDAALSSFILGYFPPALKGITIAALLAAIMSTFDSFLVLATTHIVYDIGMVVKPGMKDETRRKMMPILTILLGAATVIVALYVTEILGYLSMVFSIIGAATIPALVSALYFKKYVSKVGVIAGIIAGCVVPGYLFLTKGYDVFLGDPVFSGVIASVIAIIVGSLIFRNKKEVQEEA